MLPRNRKAKVFCPEDFRFGKLTDGFKVLIQDPPPINVK